MKRIVNLIKSILNLNLWRFHNKNFCSQTELLLFLVHSGQNTKWRFFGHKSAQFTIWQTAKVLTLCGQVHLYVYWDLLFVFLCVFVFFGVSYMTNQNQNKNKWKKLPTKKWCNLFSYVKSYLFSFFLFCCSCIYTCQCTFSLWFSAAAAAAALYYYSHCPIADVYCFFTIQDLIHCLDPLSHYTTFSILFNQKWTENKEQKNLFSLNC